MDYITFEGFFQFNYSFQKVPYFKFTLKKLRWPFKLKDPVSNYIFLPLNPPQLSEIIKCVTFFHIFLHVYFFPYVDGNVIISLNACTQISQTSKPVPFQMKNKLKTFLCCVFFLYFQGMLKNIIFNKVLKPISS